MDRLEPFRGGDVHWEFTPMLGCIFGDTTGFAPGYKGSLRWRKLDLYSEGELSSIREIRQDTSFTHGPN